MKKLMAKDAYQLLIEGVIQTEDDLLKLENRWILHCLYVGLASKRIAERLKLDDDYAEALGYVHDIGRKINHANHPIEGYRYMCSKGYPNEARSCLTHSFIDNDITLTAGEGPKGDTRAFLEQYLLEHPANMLDNIVQLCDLFCLSSGFTTIEKRLLDITSRKGVYDHSSTHFYRAMELKERIENAMGCSLYDLFPEIALEDKESSCDDYQQLITLLSSKERKQKGYKKDY